MYNLEQASEIIKDSHFEDDAITVKQIEKEIVNYLDELVEEINNDPIYFFKDNYQFWKKLDRVALTEEEKQQLENVA